MPVITIVKQFMLNHDGKLTEYLPGRYEVDDAIADHWYVQAHMEGFIEPPPKTGTEQQAVLLASQAARLNESVEAQAQPPAPSPVAEPAAAGRREIQFAGRRGGVPKPPAQAPSFIDPSKAG